MFCTDEHVFTNLFQTPDCVLKCLHSDCTMAAHITCLAKKFLSVDKQEKTFCIPLEGYCPSCSRNLLWGELICSQSQPNDKLSADHWSDDLRIF